MSTDSFAWWMYQDGETPNSKPSRLLPLQLRAKVGNNYVGVINSDGLKSNYLILYVPINSLTPVSMEVVMTNAAIQSDQTTKGAIGFCLQ